MSEPPQTPPPAPDGAEEDASNPNAAFLPIGITFLVLGLGGLANDSMRGPAFAFLPVGIVFIVLSIRSAVPGSGGASAQEASPGPPAPEPPAASPGTGARGPEARGPDVTPR